MSLTDDALDEAESEYRLAVTDRFDTLRVHAPNIGVLQLPLEAIYVDLKIIVEVSRAEDINADENRLWAEMDLAYGPNRQEKLRHLDSIRYERLRGPTAANVTPPASILERISASDRPLVILGDPGAGKSTLLHLLALRTARDGQVLTSDIKTKLPNGRWLPIFIPIAAYDTELQHDTKLSIEDFFSSYWRLRGSPSDRRDMFLRALEQGRALVLFDGLDESQDAEHRRYICKSVDTFIRTWTRQGNRFAITSRLVGYREAPLSNNFYEVTISDFGFTEIDMFLTKWNHALDQRSSKTPDANANENSASRKRALLGEIAHAPHLYALARNPLLLSMLAALHQNKQGLPTSRVKIYQDFTNMLLQLWPQGRSEGERHETTERFPLGEIRLHVRAIAFWFQNHQPSGLASRAWICHEIAQTVHSLDVGEQTSATARQKIDSAAKAERIFDKLCRTDGLLAARGIDSYGFLHRTFQESFAAEAIAEMSSNDRWHVLSPHLHDARWREVLLLCGGWLSVHRDATPSIDNFIHCIFTAGSDHESLLHRDALLATAIVAEDIKPSAAALNNLFVSLNILRSDRIRAIRTSSLWGISCLARVGCTQSLQLLHSLCETALAEGYTRENNNIYNAIAHAMTAPTCLQLLNLVRQQLVDSIAGRYSEHSEFLFYPVFSSLSKLARMDSALRRELLVLLATPGGWFLNDALAPLIGDYADVRTEFVNRTDTFFTKQPAIAILVREAPELADVRPILEHHWRTTTDASVKNIIISAVARWAMRDPYWLDELLTCLTSTGINVDINTKGTAPSSLVPLAEVYPHVKQILITYISASDTQTASNAIAAVGQIARRDRDLVRFVLSALRRPESTVRRQAANALSHLGAVDTSAKTALESLILDHDSEIRKTALAGLAAVTEGHGALHTTFARQLSHQGLCAKSELIETISSLVSVNEAARISVEACLDDSDLHSRATAIATLKSPDFVRPDLTQKLLTMLSDVEPIVRDAALRALESSIGKDGAIQNVVCEIAASGQERDALGAIRCLFAAVETPSVRATLLGLVRTSSGQRRVEAAKAIARLIPTDIEVRGTFQEIAMSFTGDVLDPDSPDLATILGACLHLDLAICNVVRSKIDGIFSSVTIVDYLSEHLEFDGSAEIFWTLRNRASGLLDLVAHHAKLLDAFQQLASLRNHAWYMFRYRAVLGLSAWMNEREDVRQYILELASAGDSNIEFLILDILEPRVATDEMSCSALISLASRTVNSSMTPYYAAQRLVSHISSVPRVKEFFLRLFEDESVEFARRQLAACALSEIAEQDSDLLPLLVPWLGARTAQNHPDGRQLRRSLANNIGRAIGDRAHIGDQLLTMLDSAAWQDRQGAAWALLAIPGEKSPELLQKIWSLFGDSRAEEGWLDRLQAAKIFLNHQNIDIRRLALDTEKTALAFGCEPWCAPLGTIVRKHASEGLAAFKPLYRDMELEDLICAALGQEIATDVRDMMYMALLNLIAVPMDPRIANENIKRSSSTTSNSMETSAVSSYVVRANLLPLVDESRDVKRLPRTDRSSKEPETVTNQSSVFVLDPKYSIATQMHNEKSQEVIRRELAREDRKALLDALLKAFPSVASLRRMVMLEFGRNLEEIADGNLMERTFLLIQVAEAEGWTSQLVTGAHTHNPGNAALKEYYLNHLDTPQ